MVKMITMMKRKADITQEEFSQYWHEKHGPLALKIIPGIRRYIQNHAAKLNSGGEPRIDGIVELWFDDMESWYRFSNWYKSDEGKTLRDDEDKFADMRSSFTFVAEEKVMKP